MPTALRGVVRMWYGENRASNMESVRHAVRLGMQFASKSLEEAQALQTMIDVRPPNALRSKRLVMQHTRMVDALEKCTHGLASMKTTYRDDAALVSKLQLLEQEVMDFLVVIRSSHLVSSPFLRGRVSHGGIGGALHVRRRLLDS